ncbi:MAG: sugar ABC transporter permease [Thermoflexales bacterium]
MSLKNRRVVWAYIFLLVPLAFFLVVRAGPTIFAFDVSLRAFNPMAEIKPYVGFDNFARVFKDIADPDHVTRKAFENTLKYVIIGTPIQLALALGIAMLMNSIRRFRTIFRVIYFIPFVTSAVAVAWVWRALYMPDFGFLNLVLGLFGVPSQRFLFDPNQSLLSVTAVVVWQGLGFAVIIFLAGLQAIPETFYEAARVDGAGRWRLFGSITIPLLNPTLVYLAVLQTIAFLRMFAEVVNLTRQGDGGPVNTTTTVVLRVFREGFGSLNMGYAAAMTVLLFAMIMVISIIQFRLVQRRVEY